MLRVRAGRSFITLFDQCSVLVFHTAAVFALIHSCRGQSEVTGSLQPVVALIGDDVVLPCHLDPAMDALDMTLEWARPDLDPRFVLVWRDGADLESKKHPSYNRRTSMFTDELRSGNISLKISKVKQSDEGTYICFVPELNRDAAVQLLVGAASSPVAQMNRTSSRVVLQCESAGWYPEPELLWLDAEGNLLPAGPTETLRGPDGLYTVSSRVTVEKRHSNNFTCRVQQKNINQSRETHIHVPDDFFMVVSPSSPPSDPTIDPNTIIGLVIGAVVVLLLIPAVFCVVWKRRRDKCRNKKSEEDGPEETRKEKMIKSKTVNCEFHVVVEEGESEPLMAGREEEDGVESRGEKNLTEERETQQDETETEQRRDANRPETNTSAMTEKESQIKMKQETHEEQNKTGRKATNYVESRGEQSNKEERKRADHHVTEAELKEEMNQFILTEKVSQSTTGQETDGKQEMRGRGMKAEGGEGEREKQMEGGKDDLGLQCFPLTEAKSFNLTSHLNTDQKPQREKEKQQEELVEERQRERNVIRKQSEGEKKRKEEKRREQKKTREHQREKQLEERREKNQRKNQSETRMERDKDETELKYKNHQHKEEKTQERSEEEPENEKHGEGNQRESLGMTERKTEEQRGQEESRNSSVSSKVTLMTDLNIQDKRGQNQEKQPEEKSDQSREETREQPEEQRRAQSEEDQREKMEMNDEGVTSEGTNRKEREKLQLTHEGALHMINDQDMTEVEEHSGLQFPPFTEEPREQQPVVLAEAKTFNLTLSLNTDQEQLRENEKQQDQLVDKRQTESDVIRKKSDETELQISKYKNHHHKEGKTQERSEEESQNEKHVEGNQRESLGMTERKTEEQRGQEQNQEKQPEEKSDQSQEEIREQPEEQRRAQREEEDQGGVTDVSTEETHRKDEENKTSQLRQEGQLQTEQQENINQNIFREQPEESVSLTERGVDCQADRTPDDDQKNIKSEKHKAGRELHQVQRVSVRKVKHQRESRAQIQKRSKMVKESLKEQRSDQKKIINVAATARLDQDQQKLRVQEENDDCMEVDDAAHSQHAAITQQHETIKWPKEQQMLSEQKEPQEYLTEHDEDLMEVEEHSGLQFPPFTEEPREQQPVLLAEAKSFNMINDQGMMEVEEH